MKLLPLALAAAVSAAAFGSAAPALAQSGDNGGTGYGNRSQTTGAASDDDSDSGDYRDRGHDQWRGQDRDRDGWRDRDGAIMHRWMMDMMGRGPHRAPPSAGASFRFQHGRDRVDIRCPPQQSLDDCVRAAGRLMRDLAAMKHAASPSHDEDGSDGTNGKGSGMGSGSGMRPGATPDMSPDRSGEGPTGNLDTDGSRPGATTTPGTNGTPDAAPGTGDRL
jgi:hypothetical protein